MFRIYLLFLYFAIPISLARLTDPDSAQQEATDKILAQWLGVEIDGAYFFDWSTENTHHIASATEEQLEEIAEQSTVDGPWLEEIYPKRFVSDPPDECLPISRESSSNAEDFMRLVHRKCWDELLPVSWECSAHSRAEPTNKPSTCYIFMAHVAAFVIVAQLLYEM